MRPNVKINFPAPRGGVFAASHHSSLMSPNPKNAASGGEYTRHELTGPLRCDGIWARLLGPNGGTPQWVRLNDG